MTKEIVSTETIGSSGWAPAYGSEPTTKQYPTFEKEGRHHCVVKDFINDRQWGGCVEKCEEADDRTLWVDNDEYDTQVNFCPFCGYKAKKQLEKEPEK